MEISTGISLFMALLATVLAIWGEVWRRWRIRPILNVEYEESDLYARDESNNDDPRCNYLLKITNNGKSTAKNAVVKIETIDWENPNNYNGKSREIFHPSCLHWSGTSVPSGCKTNSFDLIDIYPNSFHFVDFMLVESKSKFDPIGGSPLFPKQIDDVWWSLWTDSRPRKGLKPRYDYEGKFEICFHIAAEGTKAERYFAEIQWTKDNFIPIIKIR
jgi:hypothetical protein